MSSHFEGRGAAGLVLAGKYELVTEIGRGGMGLVWRAERLDLDREAVAVKVMLSRLDSPDARARFAREAKTAFKLRSPHVVQVLDHGVDDETGSPFIVMELLEEGEGLRNRLNRLKVLSATEVMALVTHLGRALERARRFHVVHRDLKPENIFLIENGNEHFAKVLDFGLAKLFDTSISITSGALTAPGNAVGTPWYMSPEQLRRAIPDHRGDLWSLAVIVFECLVGSRPFDGADVAEIAVQIFTEDRPIPSHLGAVPEGFDAWFAKATDPDLERRFQDVGELISALQPICATSPGPIPPLMYDRDSVGRRAPSSSFKTNAAPLPAPTLAPVTRPPRARASSLRYVRGVGAGLVGLAVGLGSYLVYFDRQFAARASQKAATAAQTAELKPSPSAPLAQLPAQPALAVPVPALPRSSLAEDHGGAANMVEPPAAVTEQRGDVASPAPQPSARRHKRTRSGVAPGASKSERANAQDLIDRDFDKDF